MLTFFRQSVNVLRNGATNSAHGRCAMSDSMPVSRRTLLTSGSRAAVLVAAVGIAPTFIRPGRAYAADALSPGMIGGPTGFDGSERYQYGPDTPEGRAVEAAKAMKA